MSEVTFLPVSPEDVPERGGNLLEETQEVPSVEPVKAPTILDSIALRCLDAIKKTHKESGLSRKKYAESLGYSALSLQRFRNGEMTPTLKLLVALSNVYRVNLCWLMTGESLADRNS